MQRMRKTFGLAVLMMAAVAVVVSAEIAPDAAEMLLLMGDGETDVYIENVFYSCSGGKPFATVTNGKPENPEDYDVVEASGLTLYAPRSMSFEGNVPKIVTFPRSTGYRGVGVSNVI